MSKVMNTSTNVHNVTEIIVKEDHTDEVKWLTIKLKSELGSHDVTIFDGVILDLVNACEKALHRDIEVIREKLDKLKEVVRMVLLLTH